MTDRDISLNTVISGLLWFTSVATIGAALVTRAGPELSALGVVLACAGVTLTVRGYICCMVEREHEAFMLGREHEGGEVRRMR